MSYHYDAETDALLVTFREGAEYDESEEIYPGFVIDFDKSGRPMGLDIYMNASSFFDVEGMKQVAALRPRPETAKR